MKKSLFVGVVIALSLINMAGCSSTKSDLKASFLKKCRTSFYHPSYCRVKSTILDGFINYDSSLLAFYGDAFELNQLTRPHASSFSFHISREDGFGRSVDWRGLCDGESTIDELLERENYKGIPSTHYVRREKETPIYELDIDITSLGKIKEYIESYKTYSNDKHFFSNNSNVNYIFDVDTFNCLIYFKYFDSALNIEIATSLYFFFDNANDLYYPVSIECKKTCFETIKGWPITIYSQFDCGVSDSYNDNGIIKKYIYDVDEFEFEYEGDREIVLDETNEYYHISLSAQEYLLSQGFINLKQ